jgi:Holliday junction resolvase RusA-like endonuclease
VDSDDKGQKPPHPRATRFTLLGDPIPWARVGRSRSGSSYLPTATRKAEEAIGWAYISAGGILLPGPVSVIAYFFLSDRLSADPYKDPRDVDNLLKTVLDGLQRVAYQNDRQVVLGIELKLRASALVKPQTRVLVAEGLITEWHLADAMLGCAWRT